LILGASCRAAAFSALRAGLRPHCADYFADRDLAAVCPVVRIDPLKARREFLAVAESLPPSPWFYTGGFENHPRLVERIARRHRLWGASAESLRIVRDPARVAEVMRERGIPVPGVRHDPQGLPRDGSWLVKPLRSGGGRDILPLTEDYDGSLTLSPFAPRKNARFYFQQRIIGPSFSALYMGKRQGTRLVGVTQQLLGLAGNPFAYRGSIGPWPIDDSLAVKLRGLGDALVSASGLVGLFGVDYVLRDGEPWPVEVNPRYTASVEVHELATGETLVGEHCRACEGEGVLAPAPTPPVTSLQCAVAKLVIHAPSEWTAPEIALGDGSWTSPSVLTAIADVPWPGTRFDAGDPVMTLIARGESVTECQSRLTGQEREWIECLGFVAN
jgi:predicted ATP-grasp superfamily ATP-dependent carboligase